MSATFKPGQATVYRSIAEIAQLTRAFRKLARPVVLVPISGSVHAGHISLVRAAKAVPGAVVVVSVYSNQEQSHQGEGKSLPLKELSADVDKLQAAGVDAVFAPSTPELFPQGLRTTIHPGELGAELEGRAQPDRFSAALTALHKLMQVTHCTHAVLGEKHYQFLHLAQQMVTDLNLGVQLIGAPIIRGADGLALSRRHAALSPTDREIALTLSAALTAAAYHAGQGPDGVLSAARAVVNAQPGIELDYFELRGPGFGPVDPAGANRLLVAARVGDTRLIDNIGIDFGSEEVTGQPRGES